MKDVSTEHVTKRKKYDVRTMERTMGRRIRLYGGCGLLMLQIVNTPIPPPTAINMNGREMDGRQKIKT